MTNPKKVLNGIGRRLKNSDDSPFRPREHKVYADIFPPFRDMWVENSDGRWIAAVRYAEKTNSYGAFRFEGCLSVLLDKVCADDMEDEEIADRMYAAICRKEEDVDG